jgi:hypothetical protein
LCGASNLSLQKYKRKNKRENIPQADIPPQFIQNAWRKMHGAHTASYGGIIHIRLRVGTVRFPLSLSPEAPLFCLSLIMPRPKKFVKQFFLFISNCWQITLANRVRRMYHSKNKTNETGSWFPAERKCAALRPEHLIWAMPTKGFL